MVLVAICFGVSKDRVGAKTPSRWQSPDPSNSISTTAKLPVGEPKEMNSVRRHA